MKDYDSTTDNIVKNVRDSAIENNHADLQSTWIKYDVEKSEVTFKLQNGPIKVKGRNGVGIMVINDFLVHAFSDWNKKFPTKEGLKNYNEEIIDCYVQARIVDGKRTRDRVDREVEGTYKR